MTFSRFTCCTNITFWLVLILFDHSEAHDTAHLHHKSFLALSTEIDHISNFSDCSLHILSLMGPLQHRVSHKFSHSLLLILFTVLRWVPLFYSTNYEWPLLSLFLVQIKVYYSQDVKKCKTRVFGIPICKQCFV